MPRDGQQWAFRDALDSVLAKEGGDFKNARFTVDTVIRIERWRIDGTLHVKEIELGTLVPDMVDPESYISDFMGEEE